MVSITVTVCASHWGLMHPCLVLFRDIIREELVVRNIIVEMPNH